MCIGQASMGAFLLSGGAKDNAHIAKCANDDSSAKRRSPGPGDRYRDSGEEILFLRVLNGLLATHRQPIDVIERDTERDRFMSANRASNTVLSMR